MNELIDSSVQQTMTSREVAELTGKQHSHVMRDIRAMVEKISADPNLDWHCKTEAYIDDQGKSRDQYLMDKDTTLTLVSGYDPVTRFRIIKRWQELEGQQTMPAPQVTDPALAAIIQAVVQIDQVRQQQARLAAEQQRLQSDYEVLAEQQRITDCKVEDFSTGAEHYSVTAYCKLFRGGYSISHQEANMMGKKLSAMAKNMGIELGRAPHPLFGTVNTYPKALMDEFFLSLESSPMH